MGRFLDVFAAFFGGVAPSRRNMHATCSRFNQHARAARARFGRPALRSWHPGAGIMRGVPSEANEGYGLTIAGEFGLSARVHHLPAPHPESPMPGRELLMKTAAVVLGLILAAVAVV
jgi:hypothetical protein